MSGGVRHFVARALLDHTREHEFGSESRSPACHRPGLCEAFGMTPDPEDKVRRPQDVPTDDPASEPASARDGDDPADALYAPRRSSGSISGSMPAIRGPRDRGRRN